MNRLISFFPIACVVVMLSACAPQKSNEGSFGFEGRFIGYSGEYVEFFISDGNGGFKEVPFDVAEDGSFNSEIDLGGDLYDAALFADKFMFRVSVEAGKQYHAEFDLTDPECETNFRFIGEGEAENAFVRSYVLNAFYSDSAMRDCGDCDDFKSFLAGLDNVFNRLSEELSSIQNKPFVDFWKDNLASRRMMYSCLYPVIQISNTGEYVPDASFIKFVRKAGPIDEMAFNNFSSQAAYMSPGIDLKQVLLSIDDIAPDGKTRDKWYADLLATAVGAGNISTLKEAYEYYCTAVADPDEDLCNACESALSLGPGTPAPDIEFTDIDGNVHHLTEFAGKPLYIDLWASWCGPCCAEIPHLARMVDTLGDDPEIVCISISIDDDRNDWTAKLAEENPSWPQFLASKTGQKSISGTYNVSGIPRFMLLNSDGTIASLNAPRPSDPDIINSLKALL